MAKLKKPVRTKSGGGDKPVSADKPSGAAGAAKMISSWEDDPGDPKTGSSNTPISIAVPIPGAAPLPFKFDSPTPPIGASPPNTPNFRFWAAAAALRRTADFWGPIIGVTTWQVGKTLPVILDSGVDLNAFYTRGEFGEAAGLHFFHDTVSGRTYFSGESPDVACHEMGHAVLDAFRPQLFHANTVEAAAFHESFGDMSAILSALQVPSFRTVVLDETNGKLNRNSRLSRLAEQLGGAIRVQHPSSVDADALRNACNAFFYHDPQTLPPSAPATQLSSEAHSFSRVFTAAFLDSLSGMLIGTSPKPTSDQLLAISKDMGRLLVKAVLAAAVVPDYFSQVAAALVTLSDAKYKDAFKSAFVRRGILSLSAVSALSRHKSGMAAFPGGTKTMVAGRASTEELPQLTISSDGYGLKNLTLKVHMAAEPKHFGVTGSSLTTGPLEATSAQSAAEAFTEDLFQTGRVDAKSFMDRDSGFSHPISSKTHVIVEQRGELVLKRNTFACGFDGN